MYAQLFAQGRLAESLSQGCLHWESGGTKGPMSFLYVIDGHALYSATHASAVQVTPRSWSGHPPFHTPLGNTCPGQALKPVPPPKKPNNFHESQARHQN
jgi:hypothetical protein